MAASIADLSGPNVPNLSTLSPDLYVRFDVKRFRAPRVLWLNEQWFAGSSNAPTAMERAELERLFLQRFAVSVPSEGEPDANYVGEWRHLFADRYGGTRGSIHGGSGRVGSAGGFHAKGIGRTPLVSERTDWFHSHGCMWLEEAIREVIYSEIAQAEFPHGAVPVVALIDTGERIHWRDGSTGARRALIVRPNFIRIASLQRSIFFGDAGTSTSAQACDARRTKDLWRTLWADANAATEGLVSTFRRVGEQYGFSHAARLWPGPFFTSNVSLDGQLVDFGSMRALPSWQRAQPANRDHGFGAERKFVLNAAQSLTITGSKYGRAVPFRALEAAFLEGLEIGFQIAIERSSLPRSANVMRAVRSLFRRQQRTAIGLDASTDDAQWPPRDEERLEILSSKTAALDNLPAFLIPRGELRREQLLADIETMLSDPEASGAASPHHISSFIQASVSRASRIWHASQ